MLKRFFVQGRVGWLPHISITLVSIWIRHAARLPPPPIFDDRRLVQLIAFRKLQIIDEIFGVCVFTWKRVSAFFESKHPKRVPEYMTFRLMTFLAIYKSYCKQIWNALKNDIKTHQNSSKIHPKSTKMVPRSAPKAILETSQFQGCDFGAGARVF